MVPVQYGLLSTGVIIGIVVGVIVLLAVAVAVAVAAAAAIIKTWLVLFHKSVVSAY